MFCMSDLEKVIRFKEMNNIPYSKDEIEYWGPVDDDFSDVFYKIGNTFISDHYALIEKERMAELRKVFALMLVNTVYFSKKSSERPFPYVYFNLNYKKNTIVNSVAIQIETNCFELVQNEIKKSFSISKEDLKQLDETKSTDLHLLMKLSGNSFEGDIIKKGEDHWLVFKIILD